MQLQTVNLHVASGAFCLAHNELASFDEPFGELIFTNSVHVAPDLEVDLRMQVWATNGTYATPRSAYVIIPRKT